MGKKRGSKSKKKSQSGSLEHPFLAESSSSQPKDTESASESDYSDVEESIPSIDSSHVAPAITVDTDAVVEERASEEHTLEIEQIEDAMQNAVANVSELADIARVELSDVDDQSGSVQSSQAGSDDVSAAIPIEVEGDAQVSQVVEEPISADVPVEGDAQVSQVVEDPISTDVPVEGDAQVSQVVEEPISAAIPIEVEGDAQVSQVVEEPISTDVPVEGDAQVSQVVEESISAAIPIEVEGDAQVSQVVEEPISADVPVEGDAHVSQVVEDPISADVPVEGDAQVSQVVEEPISADLSIDGEKVVSEEIATNEQHSRESSFEDRMEESPTPLTQDAPVPVVPSSSSDQHTGMNLSPRGKELEVENISSNRPSAFAPPSQTARKSLNQENVSSSAQASSSASSLPRTNSHSFSVHSRSEGDLDSSRGPNLVFIEKDLLRGRKPDFSITLLLVGNISVGKTQLSRRIESGIRPDPKASVSPEYRILYFERPDTNQVIELRLLDTAGSDRGCKIMSSYLHRAHGFLPVFSTTDVSSLQDIGPWIHAVSQEGARRNKYKMFVDSIIANKCDLSTPDLDAVDRLLAEFELKECLMMSALEQNLEEMRRFFAIAVSRYIRRLEEGAFESDHAPHAESVNIAPKKAESEKSEEPKKGGCC